MPPREESRTEILGGSIVSSSGGKSKMSHEHEREREREREQNCKQRTSSVEEEDEKECPHAKLLSTLIPFLVFVDGFSVSLVVPLLHQYYKRAGVTSATQRELLAALYTSSQIVGGLILGFLSDSRYLSRRSLLLLSFVGSVVAYFLITVHVESEDGGLSTHDGTGSTGNIHFIMASRVLVGLIKQTMTVSNAFLARCTPKKDRASKLARVQASSTVAWIAGPSAGAVLYRIGEQWDTDISLFNGRFRFQTIYLPIYMSCLLFSLNATILCLMVPANTESKMEMNTPTRESNKETQKENGQSNRVSSSASFTEKIQTCFTSRSLATSVAALLLHGWIVRTTSYQQMASYYEDKYSMEPHQRGYLSSYQASLAFLVQTFGVNTLLNAVGRDERYAICIASFVLTMTTIIETQSNLHLFLGFLVPVIKICNVMMGVSLKTLLSHVTPKESIGSVFAVVDVLQNAAAVTVPFYRTVLFRIINQLESCWFRNDEHGHAKECHSLMEGDPNPNLWLVSSAFHWTLATIAFCCLLLPNKRLYDVAIKDKRD